MLEHNLIETCLDEFEHAGHAGADDDVPSEHFPALLATPGIASEVVADVARTADPDRRALLILFKSLLERARLDAEARCRVGERFLDEVFAALDAIVSGDVLDGLSAARVARAFTRAGIEVPQSLLYCLKRRLEAQAASGRLSEHIDGAIDWFERHAEQGEVAPHEALEILLGVLPPEFNSMFLDHVAARDDRLGAGIMLYCLLHTSSDVRIRAASDLQDRASSGRLESAALGMLAVVRNWIPADDARGMLDATLRTALRQERFRPLELETRRAVQLQISFPTGSGGQALFVTLEGEEGLAVATVLLDARRGVTCAFVLEGSASGDQQPTRATGTRVEIPEVQGEAVEMMLSAALADGLAAGVPPPAGLIEVAIACGLTELRPQPMTARAWLSRLDPAGQFGRLPEPERERLIGRSALWPADHEELRTWFEGTKEYDEAVKSTNGVREAEAAFWERLEERRGDWALRMLRAAHVLKISSEDDDEWRSFAVTASAVLDGRALETVPIMVYIFNATVDAWQGENDVLPESDGAGESGIAAPIAVAVQAT